MNSNQLTTKQKHSLIILCLWVILFIAVVVGLIVEHNSLDTAIHTNHVMTTRENTAENQYDNKKDNVRDEVLSTYKTTHDPIIKSIGENQFENNAPKPVIDKFFKVFYNWSSNASYEARPGKLSNIASQSLLKNKKWFDKGKDSSGGNYIDNLQLNSVLNNITIGVINQSGDNLNLAVDAQYTAWHGDTNNKAQGSHWFNVTFNTKKDQITNMSTLYDNPKESSYSDNGENSSTPND